MSVFRIKGSPYYQFDFQIKNHRFYGSTESENEREAKNIEKAKRAEATRLVADSITTGRKPMTVAVAFDRWWDQVGRHGSDPDLERALGWLSEQLGRNVALHDINDDMLSRAVEARRKCVMRSGIDDRRTQLYRPISNRTVNKTVTSLLRRVMRRARKSWSVTILNEPEWKEHFLPERKRPIRELSTAEIAAIDGVESVDYSGLWEFATIIGLRRKEMLLTWPQVDFELSVIRIVGKGGTPAILPLTKRAYEILWNLRGNHGTSVFTFVAQRTRPCPKTGAKFIRGQRYPITYYGMGSDKRKWAKAGVDARIHDLRHTAGMRTLRSTGNLKLVQKLLRHTDIKTTSTFYADALVEDIRAGLEATAKSTESQKKSQTGNETVNKTMKDKA
jgi:integrase